MDVQRLADNSSNSRPDHRALALAGGVLFGGGLIVADKYGLAGTLEWAVFLLIGTGLAVALFWARRSAAWFWPTVFVVVAAHIGVLCLVKWHPLPPGSGTSAKGAPAIDFAVSALVFYIVRGFFDPEAVAKTRPAATAKYIKLGFAIICLAIPLGLAAIVSHAYAQKLTELRTVFTSNSNNSKFDIMTCLEPHLSVQSWQASNTPNIGTRYFDTDLGERFTVIELPTMRQAQVETVGGRRLPPTEARRISLCLPPAGN